MPHIIIEYTKNLVEEGDIPALLQKINDALLEHPTIIPIGGLRTRAIRLDEYVVADGVQDDAFVHATMKLGGGRTEEQLQLVGDAAFNTIVEHFQTIFDARSLALSLEMQILDRPTYKKNNIHLRYKK